MSEKGGKFQFETVTVNAKGEIVTRTTCEAYQQVEDLGNGVTLDMVYIPGGTFLMGQTEAEKKELIKIVGKEEFENCYGYELPQHEVRVSDFWMGKYPVTQAQWEAVMGNNPSYFKGVNRPVEFVSWDDAVAFCKNLSQQIGQAYRLPSEAEWEYACRAGTVTPFYFGETITTELANYNGDYTCASGPKETYREQTTDVGSFPPNAFGLYDMHGNVWEWCADPLHKNYDGAPTDGSVWEKAGNASCRMLRGGAWYDDATGVRCAVRDDAPIVVRRFNFGLRVVVARVRIP